MSSDCRLQISDCGWDTLGDRARALEVVRLVDEVARLHSSECDAEPMTTRGAPSAIAGALGSAPLFQAPVAYPAPPSANRSVPSAIRNLKSAISPLRIPACRTSGRRLSQSGFTLIEVILSLLLLVIMLGMVYGVLTATLNARERVEELMSTSDLGPSVLQIMASDLRASVNLYNYIPNTVFFQGEDNGIGSADRLDFVCSKDSWDEDRQTVSGLTCVGYSSEASTAEFGTFRLFRREESYDDTPLKGGKLVPLTDRVKSLDFQFYDGKDWQTSWDSKQYSGIPKAIKIELHLLLKQKQSDGRVTDVDEPYTTTVTLPGT